MGNAFIPGKCVTDTRIVGMVAMRTTAVSNVHIKPHIPPRDVTIWDQGLECQGTARISKIDFKNLTYTN